MTILVTGGCGFIGSALIRHLIAHSNATIVNLDALAYAANPQALQGVATHPRYHFVQADISDAAALNKVLAEHNPDTVINLAAETHVDNSISGPGAFIHTNIVGTYTLLEALRQYWQTLAPTKKAAFRLHHISTDEVYGDLPLDSAALLDESAAYRPSSPYSATKASADHLVMAWHRTYGLPVVISACSNNYGPYQYPEKLIPVVVQRALASQSIPIYGDGLYVRDWLHVDDHARALWLIAQHARLGERYNVTANQPISNIDLVGKICAVLDQIHPRTQGSYREQIQYVADRPGHDRKYAVSADKLRHELGWVPAIDFDDGLAQTVIWFAQNRY